MDDTVRQQHAATLVVVAKVDPVDLIDSNEAALILGLSNRNGVAVLRRRYSDFPGPAVEKGRCLLWLRTDVEAWAKRTGRQPS